MKHRHLKHLFTALLLLCTTVASAHDFEVDGIYYNILSEEDKTVEVTYSGTYYSSDYYEYQGNVKIPETVTYNSNTYSVSSIGEEAFRYCSGLTSIVIPNSITSIGNYGFNDCSSLISVTIGNNVTSIGYDAFRDCTSLEVVKIPNSVTDIGYMAFYGCKKLKSVIIPEGVKTIKSYMFYQCESLSSVTLPNSITSIEHCTFYGCSQLTNIIIPDAVTSIGGSAFYECRNLSSITIGKSVTSIDDQAFSYCSNLKTVINYSNLNLSVGSDEYGKIAYYATTVRNIGELIGDFNFRNVNGIIMLTDYLGESTNLILPSDYKGGNYQIGEKAFYGYSSLTSVTIPNSVTSIGQSAFYGCSGLTSITIPNSVTSIGEEAFYRCTGLTNVVIPNSVTSIGDYAFEYCRGLTSIVIPNSVTSIGNSAFHNCSGLTSVEIPNSVTSIGGGAFDGCSGLTSIEIPNSVTSIGSSAFSWCTGLTNVVIPNSVTSIGEEAFSSCTGFTSIEIPNSVTSIGYRVFSGCSGLTSIEIPNSVTSIGSAAFDGCTGLTSVVIPNSVTSIGFYAFRDCSGLTSIEIPNSVTSIGDKAFYGCTALKTVTNDSELYIEKGSILNGYVAYYANQVIVNEFKFELVDGVYTLVKYRGWGVKQEETITFYSWTSTNKGQSSSTSSYKYTFDATVGSKLSFDWSVSSEPDYDKLYVIIDGNNILTASGVQSYNKEYTFTVAGSHTMEVRYYKDESVNKNNDEAKIYNVKLTKTVNKPADVVLPDNYEGDSYVIGESAFENNEFVAGVTIPEGVEMICNKAFAGCSNLENIVIPNSMSAIGGDAFAGTKWYDNKEDGMVYAGNVLYKYKGSMPENTAITINDGTLGVAGLAFANCTGLTYIEIPASVTNIGNYAFDGCTGLTSITSLIPAEYLFSIDSNVFNNVDKNACTLYVPYGAKETYAATEGWEDFVNIEGPKVTITINQYGCATYCSPYALDFSEVEGLKAYAATGYDTATQVVTLTRVQSAKGGIGLFLKAEPGEYVIPLIENSSYNTLNLLVGTLEQTTVNSTEGAMSNYKFTILPGDETPMFYPFEDGTTLSAGKAYLQIPTAWLPVTAQKSLSIRFDDGTTTDIDEVKGESGEVKTVYDLSGRVVENPTSGIYIIDGKKVLIK